VHFRVDENAAGGVARADEVGMCIPDPFRVESCPGCPDQFMPGDRRRQADAAGIPENLLGPESPGCKPAGAGKRGAAQQEFASVQG